MYTVSILYIRPYIYIFISLDLCICTNDYLEPYCTVDSTNHANIPEASRPSPRWTLSFGPKVYEWNRVGGNLEEGA